MEAVLAQKRRIRSPVGAGLFYPEDKMEILDYFRSFGLDSGRDNGTQTAQAIIAPHGAWHYSGALAAQAFLTTVGRKNIKRVVILGPIHDKRERGLFLSNSHSFYTPLGNIPVDHEISEELEFNSNFFEINDIPHLAEHSIEILLPFIKYCFPDASIVPVLMGQPKAQYIYDLAQALRKAVTPVLDDTLIVVSSNLSYDSDQAAAKRLALECIRLFSERRAGELASAILEGRLNACGGALVAGLLESGLLDKTETCLIADDLVSATGNENAVVYYSELSYI